MNKWKILKLNLSEGPIGITIDEEIPFWGGRGFIAHWLYQNVNPNCDPLSEENDLVLSTGLLAGSGASSSTRLSIGGKSPLTGGIKESNTGGIAGHVMSLLGLRAIILQGACQEWSYLYISADGAKLLSAEQLIYSNIYVVTQLLQKVYGNKVAIISIGIAGETGYAASSIGITDREGVPARHSARGGLAAVMGSKKIKAIVIDPGNSRPPIPSDPNALKIAKQLFVKMLIEHPSTGSFLPKLGTAGTLKIINDIGGLPTLNFRIGKFDGADKIDGDALYNLIVSRGGKPTHSCMPSCVIRCSNVIPSEYGEEINRALEFETIALLGSNCGIDDLDIICELNRRCDEIGIDTIETGATIAVAMEGGVIEFGDGEGALRLLDEIEKGTDFGRILGSGVQRTGEYLGVTHIPAVKGQAISAYDPRVLKGTGVTYATSPMGADHTAGNALPNTKLPNGEIPVTTSKYNQVRLSSYLQRMAMIFDILGLCWFARGPIIDNFSVITDILTSYHGKPFSLELLFGKAKQALQYELDFNQAAGLPPTTDLPKFFREEPLPPTGNVFDIDVDDLETVHWLD